MTKNREYIDKSNGGGGIIKPTGRRSKLDSLPVRSFIIMEAKIMKMAKKFLAVALAGVLALSVLTGCGNSVKSKDVAKALTKMGIKVEQSKDVDKAAENTLTAIEAIINSGTNTNADEEQKITLDNAVGTTGKLIAASGVMTGADTGSKVQTALGIQAGGANENKLVRVALVKTENAKKDANLQAGIVVKGLVTAKVADTTKAVEPGKLGTAKTSDGKYMLVVIVNEISDN